MAIISKGKVIAREEHKGDINTVSTKGKLIASGGDDEKVIIWKLNIQ